MKDFLTKKRSIEEGNSSELRFKKVATSMGYKVSESTNFENKVLHIDYKLSKNGKTFYVDVKAKKRISRMNDNTQDNWIWIEFLNVIGKKGWIYGKSDYIAFEGNKDFLMVKREDLMKYAEKTVNLETIVHDTSNAKYKGYRRKTREKELVSLINKNDILDNKNNILYKIWPK